MKSVVAGITRENMSETQNQVANKAWPESEVKVAVKLTLLLLLLLTLSKSFLGAGWFASICYTGLAAFQLYVPIWRAEKKRMEVTMFLNYFSEHFLISVERS